MPDLRGMETAGSRAATHGRVRHPYTLVHAPARADEMRAAGRCAGAIELCGVSKTFSESEAAAVCVVEGVDLVLPSGSAVLIEGVSGSGKTTLLGLIACLVRPTAGRIRVAGIETTRLPEDQLAELRRRWFGFVFQDHHLIRGATALDNVVIPALPCPGADGDLRSRGRSLLARLGLAGRADHRVERLSGGEQQRVAIARALINDPSCLLADEPTAHLDAGSGGTLLEQLGRLHARGTTLVVASHDPDVCRAELFTRRFELRSGRLREGGRRWF